MHNHTYQHIKNNVSPDMKWNECKGKWREGVRWEKCIKINELCSIACENCDMIVMVMKTVVWDSGFGAEEFGEFV